MNLDNLKKQAKLLVRWHREGNYSVGGRIRRLPRYRELTDVQFLSLKFPLGEAQEIIALEAGYASWAELKTGLDTAPKSAKAVLAAPALKRAIPVVFVANPCEPQPSFIGTSSALRLTSCTAIRRSTAR